MFLFGDHQVVILAMVREQRADWHEGLVFFHVTKNLNDHLCMLEKIVVLHSSLQTNYGLSLLYIFLANFVFKLV